MVNSYHLCYYTYKKSYQPLFFFFFYYEVKLLNQKTNKDHFVIIFTETVGGPSTQVYF